MRLRRTLTLLAGAACTALTAGVLMAGTALAAVHPDSKHRPRSRWPCRHPRSPCSTSDPQALTVAKVHTSTTLTLSAAKVAFGHEQAERLSVQVTAATGASPAGQVAINAGATRICTVTLASGKGSCPLTASKLAVGTHQLTATYNGDGTHARSTSAKKTLTVTK